MIPDSNLDCQINPDQDVCQIFHKMLWILSLVGTSHFAKFCKNRAVTVCENPNTLFRNGEENGKVTQN